MQLKLKPLELLVQIFVNYLITYTHSFDQYWCKWVRNGLKCNLHEPRHILVESFNQTTFIFPYIFPPSQPVLCGFMLFQRTIRFTLTAIKAWLAEVSLKLTHRDYLSVEAHISLDRKSVHVVNHCNFLVCEALFSLLHLQPNWVFSSRICSLSLEIALTHTQRFFSLIIHHDSTYEEKKNAIKHRQLAEKSVDKEDFLKKSNFLWPVLYY